MKGLGGVVDRLNRIGPFSFLIGTGKCRKCKTTVCCLELEYFLTFTGHLSGRRTRFTTAYKKHHLCLGTQERGKSDVPLPLASVLRSTQDSGLHGVWSGWGRKGVGYSVM